MRYLTTIACAAILAGCTQHADVGRDVGSVSAASVSAATLEQFQKRVDHGYIEPFMAGDVDRWVEILDDDVVGLHNRLPALEGKQALRGFGEFVAANVLVAEMSVSLAGFRRDGNLAYTWGTFRSRLLMRESGEPMPGHREEGKVLFVWKLQDDGSWKIVIDMGNDLPSSPAS